MKVIIAGSREFSDYELLCQVVEKSGFDITEVVSGCARGTDKLGERWAKENGIPVKKFPAKWDELGKDAGYIRNREMADYADALISIVFPNSRGTRHMVRVAKLRNMECYVKVVDWRV